MSSAATERRPPSQHSFASLLPLNTIINDNEFPTLGARGWTPSSGGFSPLPTTSSTFGVAQQLSQSPLPFKDSAANHRNYVWCLDQPHQNANIQLGSSNDGPLGQEPKRMPSSVWGLGNTATLMRSNDAIPNNEFNIQSEDFPALPGAVGGSTDLTNTAAPISVLNQATEMLAAVGQPQEQTKNNNCEKGIVTHPDGEVSNIPPKMLADQFGMAGLVTYLRTVDNPAIVSLALGYDLTTLGLNLNLSERHLYSTFGGPWAETPIRPHELDVKVPEEYLTNAHVREKLPPVKLNKLSEDVLFYLFYNCPSEVYQLAAACELYARDWRFHKSDGIWLTRSQYGGVKEQTATFEKGQYNVFDPLQWRKIPKELKLEYKELEDRPKLPPAFSQSGGTIPPSQPQPRHNT